MTHAGGNPETLHRLEIFPSYYPEEYWQSLIRWLAPLTCIRNRVRLTPGKTLFAYSLAILWQKRSCCLDALPAKLQTRCLPCIISEVKLQTHRTRERKPTRENSKTVIAFLDCYGGAIHGKVNSLWSNVKIKSPVQSCNVTIKPGVRLEHPPARSPAVVPSPQISSLLQESSVQIRLAVGLGLGHWCLPVRLLTGIHFLVHDAFFYLTTTH